MEEDNRMIVTDEQGNEHELEIILTFQYDESGQQIVLFKDPDDAEEKVYAYSFDEEGNMNLIEDEKELERCEEVLAWFQEEGE